MKRVLIGIKAFWIGFILIPFISILIGLETVWDWFIGKINKNKQK